MKWQLNVSRVDSVWFGVNFVSTMLLYLHHCKVLSYFNTENYTIMNWYSVSHSIKELVKNIRKELSKYKFDCLNWNENADDYKVRHFEKINTY